MLQRYTFDFDAHGAGVITGHTNPRDVAYVARLGTGGRYCVRFHDAPSAAVARVAAERGLAHDANSLDVSRRDEVIATTLAVFRESHTLRVGKLALRAGYPEWTRIAREAPARMVALANVRANASALSLEEALTIVDEARGAYARAFTHDAQGAFCAACADDAVNACPAKLRDFRPIAPAPGAECVACYEELS